MHIPLIGRGSVVLMMAAAALTPLFVSGPHTPSESEPVRVQRQSIPALSASLVEGPKNSAAASQSDRLNAFLETANELWNRTHDARAVRELLRVAQEDLAAAAQPADTSPTPATPNRSAASAGATDKTSPMATSESPSTVIARTPPAETRGASQVPIATTVAASPLAHLPAPVFTIRASVHDYESDRLRRRLTAWRTRFDILSAAGPNLAKAALIEEGDEPYGPEAP